MLNKEHGILNRISIQQQTDKMASVIVVSCFQGYSTFGMVGFGHLNQKVIRDDIRLGRPAQAILMEY